MLAFGVSSAFIISQFNHSTTVKPVPLVRVLKHAAKLTRQGNSRPILIDWLKQLKQDNNITWIYIIDDDEGTELLNRQLSKQANKVLKKFLANDTPPRLHRRPPARL